jgi:hypothetical protein
MVVDVNSSTLVNHNDSLSGHVTAYPLAKALVERRSRRFGKGMSLNGGPLAYESPARPEPLSLQQEAALAFAACGITGSITADLPYESGKVPEAGTGNVITHLVGRTVGSADSAHTVIVFVVNDEGAWMLKRPQDHARSDIAALAAAGREYRFEELYEKNRVRVADQRVDIARDTQVMMPFNKWAANLPGTTYFIPVDELTGLYINMMLMLFSEDLAAFAIDERNRFQPAGVAKFARSKGGHLHDDPRKNKYLLPVGYLESLLVELTAVEQGMVHQNLALMTEALGLGGFPHFAAHPFMWLQTLGFRMQVFPYTKTVGAGKLMQLAARLLNKEQMIPSAIGLERNGEVLVKPFCPPYYKNMEEAVLAFVDYKFAQGSGVYRDGGASTGWKNGAGIQNAIPRYSDQTIAATIAYCDYVYKRYGRFPSCGPFRTVLAYQAHHVDTAFYDRFYRPEILTPRHREHN